YVRTAASDIASRRARDGSGRASAADESEANGRKDAGSGSSERGHERADGEDLGGRSVAVGENRTDLADPGRPVRRGVGGETGSVARGGPRGGAGGQDAARRPH